MRLEHLAEALELRALVAARLVHVDQLAYLGEREAEALAAQRELDPRAGARRIDAPLSVAARREKPLALVEADGARRDVELACEFADREFGVLCFHATVRAESSAAHLFLASLQYPWPQTPAPGATIEVPPGLHWVSMALPFALDHISLWRVKDESGWAVVDSG